MFFKKQGNSPFPEASMCNGACVKILHYNSKETSHKFCLLVNPNFDGVLVYRDGRFLGTPPAFKGELYPFSETLTEKGTRLQKGRYKTATVVIWPKYYRMRVDWGWGIVIPRKLIDPITRTSYNTIARGCFYVSIAVDDRGDYADKFLQTVVFPNCITSEYEIDRHLKEMVADLLQSKLQEYINIQKCSLKKCNLPYSFIMEASRALFPTFKDYFLNFGLELHKESERSLLLSLDLERCDGLDE